MNEQQPDSSASAFASLAVVALVFVGGGAAIAGMNAAGESEWVGAGVCAIASALSFGAILNAILRR